MSAWWCCFLSGTATQGQRRPNVVFIAIDDLRPDLGCYGHPTVKSPNIDRIAAQGMVFDRAYCQQALCGPSRLSMLTSTHPDRFGIYGMSNHLEWRDTRQDLVSLPEQFRKHGYFTVNIGKTYDPRLGRDSAHSWSVPYIEPGGALYQLPEHRAAMKRLQEARWAGKPISQRRPVSERLPVPDTTYVDGSAAEKAIDFLENYREDEPFFMALGFVRPHLPFVAPKQYWDQYDPAQIRLADVAAPPQGMTQYTLSKYKEIFDYEVDRPISEEMSRELIHGYYACISYVDAQVGKVFRTLEEKGLLDNTIVVLWGDHGYKLGDYGEWAKHTNLELDARVPLIVRLPDRRPAGTTTNALVELVDVLPTLCEVANIPIPSTAEGVSLRPVLDNPQAKVRDFALTQYPRGNGVMGYSVRTDEWRYTEWQSDYGQFKVAELYDLSETPIEQVNVRSAHPEVVETHARMLREYLKNAVRWEGEASY